MLKWEGGGRWREVALYLNWSLIGTGPAVEEIRQQGSLAVPNLLK